MKLYYAPNSRATRPRWMLEELGVPYEVVHVDLETKANRDPAYLLIHPHGQVPALDDDGRVVFESTAICMYLADRFPSRGFGPPHDSVERGTYYQWLIYCPATLEPAIGLITQHTVTLPPEQRVAPIAVKARARFDESLEILSSVLSRRPFLLGDAFTTADLVVGANLRWASRHRLLDGAPVLREYLERLMARPAARRAYAE